MTQVYVSLPTDGKLDIEIEEEREKIRQYLIHHLEIEDVYLLPNLFKDIPKANPMWAFGKSLESLSLADIVVFTKDWKSYRECRLEYIIANEYGKKIIEYKGEKYEFSKDQ